MSSPHDEHWLAGPYSTQFHCRTYTASNPKAILVFLHGFIEHVGRYEHVFPVWQQRNISVFTFDQRGFGRTAEDKEKRSKDSSYAKTSDKHQMEDTEWAVKTAKKTLGEDLPTFLMGHSMGGGIVLRFASSLSSPPSPEAVPLLSGVIVSSPLILQTRPTPKAARWVGDKISLLTPYTTIPAKVKAEQLSHDENVNKAYLSDPLVKQVGTLKGVGDMLERGEALLKTHHKNWPEHLPILIIHGTDDDVTSHSASKEFIDKIPAKDKTHSSYEGGFHELHNEPDGVKEKFVEECIAWVEAHLPASNSARL